MIIRVKKKDDPYVRIDKHFINDPTLSLKAKGIMTYLLSKPDSWHVRIGDLVNQNKDGEKAVRSGIHELIDARYLAPDITRDDITRHITKYDYIVSERPLPQNKKVDKKLLAGNRKVGNRKVGNLQVGNRVLNNKLLKKQMNTKINKGSNNNNTAASISGDNGKNFIITIPIKYKRKFNYLKKKILLMGWVGPLDEIVELHNEDPDYVKAWVQRLEKVDLYPRAGLLRKSLRSGVRPPTDEEAKAMNRRRHLEDEYAEYIEN